MAHLVGRELADPGKCDFNRVIGDASSESVGSGRHESLDAITGAERNPLEKQILGMTADDCWESTRSFWAERDPAEIDKAEAQKYLKAQEAKAP